MRNKPLRVMHLRASNFYGGPEKQIVEHLILLDRSRFNGIVAGFQESGNNDFLLTAKSRGLEIVELPNGFLQASRLLRATIVNCHVDLLCVHGYKPAIIAASIRPFVDCPMISFARGRTQENRRVMLLQTIEDLISNFFDLRIAVSAAEAQRLSRMLHTSKRTHVVHNSVTIDQPIACVEVDPNDDLRTELSLPANTFLFVCAGRLSQEKGQADLINAAALLEKTARPYCIVFCGDGPDRAKLENQVAGLKLNNEVRFAGFRLDMRTILRQMNALILPSHSEGLPNIVLEAMAHGKVVVATKVGGVPELIRDRIDGLLIEPGPKNIANALNELLNDDVELHELGISANKRVAEHFSFQIQTSKLQDVYERVAIRCK